MNDLFLKEVGNRVRARRRELGLSRREVSLSCGVSERFLGQLETGKGNISLLRFASVACTLELPPSTLLHELQVIGSHSAVALLGLRGAGKSTVGKEVAATFQVSFIEVDSRIEESAGLSLAEIFEMHGEAYYRRLEHEVLEELFTDGGKMVVATGGSIVNDPKNFHLLQSNAMTVWLKADPEDHWNRVIQQGDARPMAKNPHAFAELVSLLEERASLYAQADVTVDTKQPVTTVIEEVTAFAGKSLR